MASSVWRGEELGVFDRHGDTAAETGAGYAFGERGRVVRVGVACKVWFLLVRHCIG